MAAVTAHLNLLRQALTAKVPEPVAKALADHDAVVAAVNTIPATTTDQIAEAVTGAILDGRDPFTDEQVRRLATARTLAGDTGRGLAYSVQCTAENHVVTLTDHTDALVDTLRAAAGTIGATLTAAHEIIGDHDLDDHANILRRGDDASRAWNDARATLARLRTIDSAWTALAELTRFAPTSDSTIRLAAPTSTSTNASATEPTRGP